MPVSDDRVVRSLVLQHGLLNAHISGDLCWWPTNGEVSIAHLPSAATVLLGLKGPNGEVERVAVGDVTGAITILSLPELHHVDVWNPHRTAVTSMAVEISTDENLRLITADADGNVHMIGAGLPRKGILMRRVGKRITAIRIQKKVIILMSGWLRLTFERLGKFNIIQKQVPAKRLTQTKLPIVNRSSTPVQA